MCAFYLKCMFTKNICRLRYIICKDRLHLMFQNDKVRRIMDASSFRYQVFIIKDGFNKNQEQSQGEVFYLHKS